MAGPESFSGFEGLNQSTSAEDVEKFKERMAASAAALKAMYAGEQKQKKKEDDLAKLLSGFIHSGEKTEIIKVVIALLDKNIPAGFIIALLLIAYPALQEAANLRLFQGLEKVGKSNSKTETLPDIYLRNFILPLEVKIMIDSWIQEVSRMAQELAPKLLKYGVIGTMEFDRNLVRLPALSLNQYLLEKGLGCEMGPILKFCEVFIMGILNSIQNAQPKKLSN